MKTQASDSRPLEFNHHVILSPCFNPKSDLNWIYLLPWQSGDGDSKTGLSLTQNHSMYYFGYYCPVDSTGTQFSITFNLLVRANIPRYLFRIRIHEYSFCYFKINSTDNR